MNRQIDCEIIQDAMPLYLDGLSGDVTNEIIEEHLKECEKCRRVCEKLKADRERLLEETRAQNEEAVCYLSKKRIVYTDYRVVYNNVNGIAALRRGRKIRSALNTGILILTAAFYYLWYVNTENLAQCCVLSAIAVVASSIISAVSELIYDKSKGNVPQDMKAEYHAYIRFKINRVMFIGVIILLVITFVLSILLYK